jgi:hypothetical protein
MIFICHPPARGRLHPGQGDSRHARKRGAWRAGAKMIAGGIVKQPRGKSLAVAMHYSGQKMYLML